MARIRSVKPELRTSSVVASWPREVRYAWVLLWGYLDDYGRGLDVPKGIAGDLFPHDEDVTVRRMDQWLTTMTTGRNGQPGPLCRYQVAGVRYLHAVNWSEHQRPNRPTRSRIPACPVHDTPHGGSPPDSRSRSVSDSLNDSLNGSRNSVEPPPKSRSTDATRVTEQGSKGSKGSKGDGGSLRSPTARTRDAWPEPPADGEPGTAEQLIHGWLDTCRRPPPPTIVNDIGRQVSVLLRDGIDPPDIGEGLRLWQARGLHPNTLPSVVNQVMNSTPTPSNVVALRPNQDRRPSTTDQRVSDALALAADLAAEEAP